MKINELRPIDYAPKCKAPAFFIHGIEDDFVTTSHTEENFSAYGAEAKDVSYCEGDHNETRDKAVLEEAVKFSKKYLLD